MEKNTFGNYKFEKWVPEKEQEMIRNFWGQMGRGHENWLKSDSEQNARELCHHGPGPNGFGMPPYGAMAEYFIYDWENSKKLGTDLFKVIEGRYIHRWNNMGSLIDKEGKGHCVSTCDRWVRIFVSQKEKEEIKLATDLELKKHRSSVIMELLEAWWSVEGKGPNELTKQKGLLKRNWPELYKAIVNLNKK